MSEISLNASMRSNLLSLQQTQKLQDITQLRLSTGLKVNSAIDNPSSYYSASSLTNRADDLSALLDVMGQGIQTIKTAVETLEIATNFLEQAKASLSQTTSSPSWIAKEKENIDHTKYSQLDKTWFQTQVGANGAVVTNVAELKTAISSGKNTIVVYGNISIANEGITLAANQKLVGTEYFANVNENALYRSDNEQRLSTLSFSQNAAANNLIINKNGNEISDLAINADVLVGGAALYIGGSGNSAKINNIDINYRATSSNAAMKGGIYTTGGAIANIYGDININMYADKNMVVWGMYAASNATVNFYGHANIITEGNNASSSGIVSYINANVNIYGTIDARNCETIVLSGGDFGGGSYSGNTITIKESAVLNGYTNNIFSLGNTKATPNILNIEKGSRIYWHSKDGKESASWQISSNQTLIKEMAQIFNKDLKNFLKADTIVDDYNYQMGNSAKLAYDSILSQYNMLITDGGYKGINLLESQNLKINFNENRSSGIEIMGVDASTKGLGISENNWDSISDVRNSLDEIQSAIDQLRTFSSDFGNYYSIVNSREDFTQNLINVLTEGSDKLTLADMNEESANILALQTRQQLAINSLSLASQASKSVLRLF